MSRKLYDDGKWKNLSREWERTSVFVSQKGWECGSVCQVSAELLLLVTRQGWTLSHGDVGGAITSAINTTKGGRKTHTQPASSHTDSISSVSPASTNNTKMTTTLNLRQINWTAVIALNNYSNNGNNFIWILSSGQVWSKSRDKTIRTGASEFYFLIIRAIKWTTSEVSVHPCNVFGNVPNNVVLASLFQSSMI